MPLASFFSGRGRQGGTMNIASIQTRAAGTSPSLPRARATCSDEMLIRRIAVGDQLAMRSLFARHQTPLYRWLLRIARNETLAGHPLAVVLDNRDNVGGLTLDGQFPGPHHRGGMMVPGGMHSGMMMRMLSIKNMKKPYLF